MNAKKTVTLFFSQNFLLLLLFVHCTQTHCGVFSTVIKIDVTTIQIFNTISLPISLIFFLFHFILLCIFISANDMHSLYCTLTTFSNICILCLLFMECIQFLVLLLHFFSLSPNSIRQINKT